MLQRWSRGHMARGQGQRQPFRGQSLSRPRTKNTGASVLQKKKGLQNNFIRRFPIKKSLQNFFSGDLQNLNNSKTTAVLEPRTGQFSRTWGFEAKDIKMCPRGLHLRYAGIGSDFTFQLLNILQVAIAMWCHQRVWFCFIYDIKSQHLS